MSLKKQSPDPSSPSYHQTTSSPLRSVTDAAILSTLMEALQTNETEFEGELDSFYDSQRAVLMSDFLCEAMLNESLAGPLGQKFGSWKVLSLGYHRANKAEPYLLLRCDCGAIKTRSRETVLTGRSKSCGCCG